MLSDEVIEKVSERLVNRIEQGNEYILKQIARTIKRIGSLTPTEAKKLQQILKYGGDYDKILRELSKITKLNVKDINKIIDEMAKREYQFAKQFYDYRDIKFIPYEKNVELQQLVEVVQRSTISEYAKIVDPKALGIAVPDKKGNIKIRPLKEAYNDIIDEAILNLSQGKETFESAMKRSVKALGEDGVRVIYPGKTYKDKNGKVIKKTEPRSVRLDSAARMHIRDGLTKLHQEEQKLVGESFDYNGWEISVHGQPAEDHAASQGRQFDLDNWELLQEGKSAKDNKGVTYTLDHDHNGSYRPTGTMNCYHTAFAIVLGAIEPSYTDKQLEKIIKDNKKGFKFEGKHYTLYEGTQLQRRIETAVREWKDRLATAEASGELGKGEAEKAKSKIKALQKKYRELNSISGLQSKPERMRKIA